MSIIFLHAVVVRLAAASVVGGAVGIPAAAAIGEVVVVVAVAPAGAEAAAVAAAAAFAAAAVTAVATVSSLGRYVFGSEISYNKAPPRLPGLAC